MRILGDLLVCLLVFLLGVIFIVQLGDSGFTSARDILSWFGELFIQLGEWLKGV